jgi:cobalamin biosynthesis protein CobW
MSMRASHQFRAKIPATVITGFLGAGKTSLIRHLLGHAGGRRLALVINEFGDLGIDGGILKGCGADSCAEEDILELTNGCICCTVADEFLPTLEILLARPEPPHHIIIETSGLALPKPLVQAFNWPEIRTRVTVDGVISVIDALAVAEGRFAADPEAVAAQRLAAQSLNDDGLDHDSPLEELFEDQLACADLVVLNKTDLVGDAALARVAGHVAERVRPAVRTVRARHGAVDPAVVLGLGAAAEADIEHRPSHHDNEEEHDHDEFESFVVKIDPIEDPDALAVALADAAQAHDILRIKGFAAVRGRPMRLVVQGVGPRISHYYDRDWAPGEEPSGQLVVIGQRGLDQRAIRHLLRRVACTC